MVINEEAVHHPPPILKYQLPAFLCLVNSGKFVFIKGFIRKIPGYRCRAGILPQTRIAKYITAVGNIRPRKFPFPRGIGSKINSYISATHLIRLIFKYFRPDVTFYIPF